MKDLFVPYELAVKLKEKGFNEICLAHYSDKGRFFVYNNPPMNYELNSTYKVSAPTYDQVINWFITNHKIQLKAVAMDFEGTVKWYYECQDIKLYKSPHIDQKVFKFKVMSPNISNTYHSALKKAIKEAIKTI